MKLSDLKADRNAAEWVACPSLDRSDVGGPVPELLVRSGKYPPFVIAQSMAMRKLRRQYKGDQEPHPDTIGVIDGRLFAEHLLLGWRGIEPEYSPDVALEALTDPDHYKLRDAVAWCANIVAEGRDEQSKAIEGNSPPASDGK